MKITRFARNNVSILFRITEYSRVVLYDCYAAIDLSLFVSGFFFWHTGSSIARDNYRTFTISGARVVRFHVVRLATEIYHNHYVFLSTLSKTRRQLRNVAVNCIFLTFSYNVRLVKVTFQTFLFFKENYLSKQGGEDVGFRGKMNKTTGYKFPEIFSCDGTRRSSTETRRKWIRLRLVFFSNYTFERTYSGHSYV